MEEFEENITIPAGALSGHQIKMAGKGKCTAAAATAALD
jgi:hypothetical protein